MRWISRAAQALLLILAVLGPVAAQSNPLMPLIPFEGTISTPGASDIWTFSGLEGGVVSLLVTSTGTLDPVIELRNSTGQVLASNDDFAYPGRNDSLLQAITLPRIDNYSVNIYGYGETVGDYTLTMIPGYAEIITQEGFASASGWNINGPQSATVSAENGQLVLSLNGVRESARVERSALDTAQDFYAQARINIQRAPTGWRVGFALRGTGSGFYALAVSADGAWRMDFINSEGVARQVKDWTVHPAIRTGATTFTLGVLANERAFDVFFDGAWIGQAVETREETPDNGGIGFYGQTPDAVGSGLVVGFDDLLVTRPMRVGELDVIPSAIVPGGQALTIQELERRLVIPTGGTLALTVPESSGRQVEPGVNRVLLGRGVTFSDFVLHTTFTLTTAVPDALVGCGLLFGNASDTRHAVAFLDRHGGFGISARDGENYSPGLFGENDSFIGGQRHTLVLIKQGLRAELFVDRQHAGGLDLPPTFSTPAQIGNAVINYQRSDTSCSFADTWVWNLAP